MTTKLHDPFFRKALENPLVAREFFENHLPIGIKKLVDLDSLQVEKESFVETNLKRSISDVLFTVNFGDAEGYLYLLVEHQSTVDTLMAFRLFKYMLAICDRHLSINPKGGVGKSTFVLNIAIALLNRGLKVAVLDADAQGTITKWNKVREFMIKEGAELAELFVAGARGEALLGIANDKKSQGYIVLIDSPGVDDSNMRSALIRSDFVISTCPPSAVDLWEVESLINILKQLQLTQNRRIPLVLVFNKVPTRHSHVALDEAKQFFEQHNINPTYILKSVIKERVIFKHSIKEGKAVIEYNPSDEKAIEEITECCREILDITNIN